LKPEIIIKGGVMSLEGDFTAELDETIIKIETK